MVRAVLSIHWEVKFPYVFDMFKPASRDLMKSKGRVESHIVSINVNPFGHLFYTFTPWVDFDTNMIVLFPQIKMILMKRQVYRFTRKTLLGRHGNKPWKTKRSSLLTFSWGELVFGMNWWTLNTKIIISCCNVCQGTVSYPLITDMLQLLLCLMIWTEYHQLYKYIKNDKDKKKKKNSPKPHFCKEPR